MVLSQFCVRAVVAITLSSMVNSTKVSSDTNVAIRSVLAARSSKPTATEVTCQK